VQGSAGGTVGVGAEAHGQMHGARSAFWFGVGETNYTCSRSAVHSERARRLGQDNSRLRVQTAAVTHRDVELVRPRREVTRRRFPPGVVRVERGRRRVDAGCPVEVARRRGGVAIRGRCYTRGRADLHDRIDANASVTGSAGRCRRLGRESTSARASADDNAESDFNLIERGGRTNTGRQGS
jgi:hypothetical protein